MFIAALLYLKSFPVVLLLLEKASALQFPACLDSKSSLLSLLTL